MLWLFGWRYFSHYIPAFYPRIIYYLCLVLVNLFVLLRPTLVQAQAVQLEAIVSPQTISLNQSTTLKITLSGETQLGKIQPPQLTSGNSSLWRDLSVSYLGSSNQYRLVNGQVSVPMTWSYALKPKKAGTFTIPPISINYDGQTLRTEKWLLKVVSGSSAQAKPDTYENPFYGGTQRVEATIDNPLPFVNQQITYTFRYLYTARLPNFDSPKYILPPLPRFWKKQLKSGPSQIETIDGKRFRVEEIKVALFPMTAGRLTIEPAKFRFPASFDLTGQQSSQTLITDSVSLEIRSLPETDQPINFNGVVGRYQISATIDKSEVTVDDAVVLTVVISGFGNIETLPDLQLPVTETLTLYDPKIQDTVEVRQGKIYGQRTYEYVVIPTKPGTTTIPSISYPYFDPETVQYRVTSTWATALTVHPKVNSSVDVSSPTDGSTPSQISNRQDSTSSGSKYLVYRVLVWVFVLLTLGGSGYVGIRKIRQRQVVRRQKQRTVEPFQNAVRTIESAKSFGDLAMGIYGYVGAIYAKPALGLNPEAVQKHLTGISVLPSLIDRLVEILRLCDQEQFAPTSNQTAQWQIQLEVQQILEKINHELT